jgi:hypothetical protein
MEKRIVLEELGEPESWLNVYSTASKTADLRGAFIAAVFASGSNLAIQTRGASCGEMLSFFSIKDGDVRDRLVQVLKVGMDVHDAMWPHF